MAVGSESVQDGISTEISSIICRVSSCILGLLECSSSAIRVGLQKWFCSYVQAYMMKWFIE